MHELHSSPARSTSASRASPSGSRINSSSPASTLGFSTPNARDVARTRAMLRADPILTQVRQLARASATDHSIIDSPAELRAKLLTKGPHQLIDSLQHEARASSRTAMSSSRSSPALRPSSTMSTTLPRLDDGASGNATPRRTTTTPSPAADTAQFLTDKMPLYLVADPMKHSLVLSRVVASALRLDGELAEAVARGQGGHGTADGPAAEAARLEALRSHIAALLALKGQCVRLQQGAEARAAGLEAELAALKIEHSRTKDETARLRWALAHGYANEKQAEGALAFLEAGRRAQETQGLARTALATVEATAFQKQLDDAHALADALAQDLKRAKLERAALDKELNRLRAQVASAEGADAASGGGKLSSSSSRRRGNAASNSAEAKMGAAAAAVVPDLRGLSSSGSDGIDPVAHVHAVVVAALFGAKQIRHLLHMRTKLYEGEFHTTDEVRTHLSNAACGRLWLAPLACTPPRGCARL